MAFRWAQIRGVGCPGLPQDSKDEARVGPGPRPLILCDFLPCVFAAFPSGEVSGAGTDGVTAPSAGAFS